MKTKIHMCISIEGYLRNTATKKPNAKSCFTNDSGESVNMRECREFLKLEMVKGRAE